MSGKSYQYDPDFTVSQAELKYLGIFNYVPNKVMSIGNSWYKYGKSYLPVQLQNNIKAVESQVYDTSKPFVNLALDLEQRVLKDLDYRVEKLNQAFIGYKGDSEKFAEQVQQRRDEYLRKLEDALKQVKQNNPEEASKIEKQIDELKRVPKGAKEQLDRLQSSVNDSWNKFIQDPKIQKNLDVVREKVDLSKKNLTDAQNRLLADQRYASLYQFVVHHTDAMVFNTSFYRNTKGYVQPYLDNIFPRQRQQEYYQRAVNNVRPTTQPANSGPSSK